MATQLLSNYSYALKEVLLPYIQDNFPRQTILLDQMKKSGKENYINDEFVFPIFTSRHGGIANLGNDGNNIVNASGRAGTRGTVPVEVVTGAFDISRLAIDASMSSEGAVAADLTTQGTTLVKDFARHVNRQFHADGIGVIGQVLGSVGAGTASLMYPDANLDDGRSTDWYGTINGDLPNNKYFAVDQIIGFGSPGTAPGTVASVTGTSIVVTGNPAIAANDALYIIDGSGGGAGSSEFLGIRAALSSSSNSYAGVARTVTGWSPQFGSSSEALSMPLIENSYISATEYADDSDKYAIFVNKTLYTKYGDILTAMRKTVNKLDLVGGWKGLEFAMGNDNVAVMLDRDTLDGEVEVINLNTWVRCQVKEVGFLEDPNSAGSLLRLQNTIKYQAVMVWFANTFCLAPAANGRETRKSN